MIIYKEAWDDDVNLDLDDLDGFDGYDLDPDAFGDDFSSFGRPATRDEKDPSEFETPTLTKFDKRHIDKFGPELHPDRTYIDEFHSVTFFYDTKTGELHHANYPQGHEDIANKDNQKLGKRMGFEGEYFSRKVMLKNKSIVLGRIGVLDSHRTNPYSKGKRLLYKSVGIWNHKLTKKALNACLQALVDEFPELDRERERVVVFSAYGHAFPNFWLGEAKIKFKQQATAAGDLKANKVSPQCAKLSKVNVGGKPLTLAQILSNLHMVKGQDLSQMSTTFCAAAPTLKQTLRGKNCTRQADMVDAIWNKLGCKDDRIDLHRQALAHGWRQRADDFKRAFRNDAIDQSPHLPTFHTQRDIDRAWELANKRRPFSFEGRIPTFIEWLQR